MLQLKDRQPIWISLRAGARRRWVPVWARLAGWLLIILFSGYALALPPAPAPAESVSSAAAVPWAVMQPNYQVEVVASGFQLPVNIAFVPNPGPDPDSPYYYVAELFGTIKVVTRGGQVAN